MNLSGCVTITLPHSVQVKRPMPAEQLFKGKSVAQVMQMVPLLYSLCSQAQSVCAQLAMTGQAPNARQLKAMAMEAVREHLLFFQPFFPALKEAMRGIASWPAATAEAQQARLQAILYALGWDKGGLPDFSQVAKNLLTKNIEKWPQMPDFSLKNHYKDVFVPQVYQSMRKDARWCAQPVLEVVHENSAYARAMHHGGFSDNVSGRLAARLWDLWQWLQVVQGKPAVFSLWGSLEDEDWRLGWVETARGRLYHAAQVASDQVCAYRICAPTEWNFHPQGVLAQWLKHAAPQDAVQAQAMAQFIDPCVAVEAQHA